jgi:hydrogenase maturation protease
MNELCELLVIGYGNTFRGDDGVGQRVANAVEALQLYGVRTIAAHQLTPETAVAVADAARVIFVDAVVHSSRKQIEMRNLRVSDGADRTTEPLGHRIHPRFILDLVERVFYRRPDAYWVLVPGELFEAVDYLSEAAEAGAAAAVQAIVGLVEERLPCMK